MAGNHTLGTIRGSIEIDYDGAGIVKAVRDTDKAKSKLGDLDGASSKALSAFGKFAGGAVKTAGAVSLLTNGVSGLAAVIAVVAPLAAAGFAAAPGVILAYASAMIVAKVATAGVGAAMEAAAEGGKKFDDAMKKLSPEAQKFVRAYKGALPVMDQVKKQIQDAFFAGAAGNVAGVARGVASLGGDAANLAKWLGFIVKDIAHFVTSGERLENVRKILQGTTAFFKQIAPTIAPLIAAFIKLGAEALGFGDIAGGSVADAIISLTKWLEQLDPGAIFAKAAPIVQSLGVFLSNVAIIAGELFGVFSTDGANAAGILGELAGQLAAFLQSAQGQAALQALGQAMQAIAGAAGQIFLALLQALAPVLVALAPGIATLAGQIASVLVPALAAAGPVLAAIAQYLSENMSWLGPVAGAVVAAAAAYKVYSAAATAVGVAQDLLKSKLVASVASWTANTAAAIANRVAMAAGAVVTGAQAVAAWTVNTAAIVANRAAVLAGTIATNAARIATIAWTATTTALGVAMRFAMGPIGLIITAIGLITAAIIYLWNNNESFRAAVIAAWEWIKKTALQLGETIRTVFNLIATGIRNSVNAMKAIIQSVWAAIVAIVRGYVNAYRTIIMAVINFIKGAWTAWLNGMRSTAQGIWSGIVSVIRNAINNIKGHINNIKAIIAIVRTAFTNARTAAVQQIANLIKAVQGIRNRITGALGNLGSMLFSKGRELIQGFINGIGSMIGAVKNKVSSVVGAVTRFLPGSPAKEGPLSGRGYVLLRARRFMEDFARGIEDGRQKPTAALAGAVGGLPRATVGNLISARNEATKKTFQPVSRGDDVRVYHIGIGEKDFAELVVDAVTGAPIAMNKAVTEGSRRSAWAGNGR